MVIGQSIPSIVAYIESISEEHEASSVLCSSKNIFTIAIEKKQ